MPELPEVETIRRQLAPHLEGRTIARAEILDPRWTRPDPPAAVEAELRGAAVERLGPRRQVPGLVAVGRALPAHAPAHDRDAAVRPAGAAAAHAGAARARRRPPPRVRRPAPLRHRPPGPRRRGARRVPGRPDRDRAVHARVHRRSTCARSPAAGRAPVKAFVLDQRRIAGVGNIYADEALFRAGIHPLRPAGRLAAADWERAARGDRGGAQRRDRRQGRLDRRLPPHRRRPRLLPGSVPGPPPRRRAVSAVRRPRSARSSSADAGRTCASAASRKPRARRASAPPANRTARTRRSGATPRAARVSRPSRSAAASSSLNPPIGLARRSRSAGT